MDGFNNIARKNPYNVETVFIMLYISQLTISQDTDRRTVSAPPPYTASADHLMISSSSLDVGSLRSWEVKDSIAVPAAYFFISCNLTQLNNLKYTHHLFLDKSERLSNRIDGSCTPLTSYSLELSAGKPVR